MTSKKPIIDERIKNIINEANGRAYYLTVGLLIASVFAKFVFFDALWLWVDVAIIAIPGIYVTAKLYRNHINEYSLHPMKTYLVYYAFIGAMAAIAAGIALVLNGAFSAGGIILRSVICFVAAVIFSVLIHLIVRKIISKTNPETRN